MMSKQHGSDDQKHTLEQGYRLLSAGRYEEGMQELQKVRDLLHDDPRVYFGLGIAYAKLGQPAAALREYEHCARLAPDDGRAYLAMAYVHRGMGSQREARELMKIAAETPGDISDDSFAQGILAHHRKEYTAALGHYLTVVQRKPARAMELAAPIGSILLRLDRNAEAREALLLATALPQTEPASFFNLGIAEQRLGNSNAALQAHKAAISTDPHFYRAYLKLIPLEVRMGHWASAWRHFWASVNVPREFQEFRDA